MLLHIGSCHDFDAVAGQEWDCLELALLLPSWKSAVFAAGPIEFLAWREALSWNRASRR